MSEPILQSDAAPPGNSRRDVIDCLRAPTLFYGPLVLGTPVVAANSGAVPETVGDAGLLVDPGDPAAFADALLAVVGDDATRRRLISAGLQRAAKFPWDRTASLTDAAIGSLLDGR